MRSNSVPFSERLAFQGFDAEGRTPFLFKLLDSAEQEAYKAWFRETSDLGFIGETSMAAMGVLTGLIFGNRIDRVVQCGHYAGYSLILLGLLARKFNPSCRVFSVDVDQTVTAFTETWIDRLGLSEQVTTLVADSADPWAAARARRGLGGAPELVFIDSSHQYRHTLEELDLWSTEVDYGGIICLHDAADFATYQDVNGLGGVSKALREWLSRHTNVSSVTLRGDETVGRVFKDPCGVAIIQLQRTEVRTQEEGASVQRMIRDPTFVYADQWIAGKGWQHGPNGFSKVAGVSSAVHCFSPVIEGQVYDVELDLQDVTAGGVHPVAGGGSVSLCFDDSGHFEGQIEAGGENALLGLLATEDFVGRVTCFKARPAAESRRRVPNMFKGP